jgi:hypothetical protein
VAKVAVERSENGVLERKALGVDPSVVLVTSAQQLVIVEVDEARDSKSQNTHQAIAPSTLNHLKGELLRSRWDLSPADLVDNLVSQLPGTLLEEAITPHLGAWASKSRGQLHQVTLENEHVLMGADLKVCSRSVHLHKILR